MDNLAQFNEGVQRIRNLKQEAPGVPGVELPVPESAKRDALRDLYQHHLGVYEQLAQAKREEVATNLRKAREQLFRYRSGLGIDVVQINMSTRDAMERLQGITDPQELRARLADAAEFGDQVMAKCILRKGVELGEDFGGADIVRDYLAHYPGEAQAYSQLESASLEADRIEQWGVSGTPSNPEDASQSFSSPGGGLIPDSIIGQAGGQ
jgi:hypothetical protein